ncbi:MAG: SanA protein [Polaribacter sp.]|jgi:SanA protein
MKKKKRTLIILIFIIPIVSVFLANYLIEKNAAHKTFSNKLNIKKNKVDLVLGTAKLLQNDNINLYFTYRINATA